MNNITTESTTPKKPGKWFMSQNGNMFINFHNTFFIMTRFGHYIPCNSSLHHGKMMPQQEWQRIRDLNGGAGIVKELKPFLNEKAAIIAENLKKDPFYKMSDSEKETAIENRQDYLNAQTEGVCIEEYLRRKALRKERAQKKAITAATAVKTKVVPMPVKPDNGHTNFFLGSLPGFNKLRQKFS